MHRNKNLSATSFTSRNPLYSAHFTYSRLSQTHKPFFCNLLLDPSILSNIFCLVPIYPDLSLWEETGRMSATFAVAHLTVMVSANAQPQKREIMGGSFIVMTVTALDRVILIMTPMMIVWKLWIDMMKCVRYITGFTVVLYLSVLSGGLTVFKCFEAGIFSIQKPTRRSQTHKMGQQKKVALT
ncbi:hypothetical protein ASPCAL01328 [Aspergillus calidoustus]|uniref:Uncharacterized protein n=1 Tax=Aspergillus calidoustus TaxID=454130 RepID=A0A0U4YXD2_ASPCI|nr:hypothetical protein ASPCAL01328 [Aspergillus calidoustus]